MGEKAQNYEKIILKLFEGMQKRHKTISKNLVENSSLKTFLRAEYPSITDEQLSKVHQILSTHLNSYLALWIKNEYEASKGELALNSTEFEEYFNLDKTLVNSVIIEAWQMGFLKCPMIGSLQELGVKERLVWNKNFSHNLWVNDSLIREEAEVLMALGGFLEEPIDPKRFKVKNQHVEYIDLSDLNLRFLPDILCKLSELKDLDISNNRLDSLDESLLEKRELKIISSRWNKDFLVPAEADVLLRIIKSSGRFLTPSAILIKNGHIINLNLSDIELLTLPNSINDLLQLKTLLLSGNNLKTLPELIEELVSLEELDLSFNNFGDSLFTIKFPESLKKLRINTGVLTAYPASISRLSLLEILDISNNQIASLPSTIGELKNLLELKINHNRIDALPSTLVNLSKLTRLEAHSNNIKRLPESIGKLKSLKFLNLSLNKLKILPSSFENLKEGYIVNLMNNSIPLDSPQFYLLMTKHFRTEYSFLGGLPKNEQVIAIQLLQEVNNKLDYRNLRITDRTIQKLLLVNQNIKKFPEMILGLQNLKVLDLSANKIENIPESIHQLKSLEVLKLTENSIKFLPSTIGKLTNLKLLELSNNEDLVNLPSELDKLKLERIGTDWYSGKALPCKELLFFKDMRLTPSDFVIRDRIPLEIIDGHVTELTLTSRNLETLPHTIGNFGYLTSLNLVNNNLNDLPETLANLKRLKYLNIGSNKYKTLPESIWQLTELENLFIQSNEIENLPSSIKQLRNLKYIGLQNTKIISLPTELVELPSLESIGLTFRGREIFIPPSIKKNQKVRISADIWGRKRLPPDEALAISTMFFHLQMEDPLIEHSVDRSPTKKVKRGGRKPITRLVIKDETAIILNLSNLGMTILPDEIGNLQNLQELILDGNSLTSLPATLSSLNQLKMLSISDNNLENIPSFIGQLISLERLILANNKIQTLPEDLKNLAGQLYLNLANNNLKILPDWLEEIKSVCIFPGWVTTKQEFHEVKLLHQIEVENEVKLDSKRIKRHTTQWGIGKIQELDLSALDLQTLPEEIGELEYLQILNLSGNKLTFLPESISKCQYLQKIYLNGNKLNSFPNSIGNLTHLEDLTLTNNELSSLPPLPNLTKLKTIFLLGNKFPNIPEVVTRLQNKQTRENRILYDGYLDLGLNAESMTIVCNLPREVRTFIRKGNVQVVNGNITQLSILNQEFKTLPGEIFTFSYLTEMSIENCNLEKLNSTIGKLSRLVKLELGGNSLELIPDSIGKLMNLQYLDLSNNNLTHLSSTLTFSNLKELNLEENPLERIPNSISSHPDFKLIFSEKKPERSFYDLPNWVQTADLIEEEIQFFHDLFNCFGPGFSDDTIRQILERISFKIASNRIISLHINRAPILSLPESIDRLITLESFSIRQSNLRNLPESFGNLQNLETLNLTQNNLESLPNSLGNLIKLKKLFLSEPSPHPKRETNKITVIPESIGQLINLEELYIAYNQLTKLPDSIDNMKLLKILDLRSNKIGKLPKSLGNMISLQILKLAHNNLKTLPISIGQLENLKSLSLDYNPLEEFPKTVQKLTRTTISLQGIGLKILPEELIYVKAIILGPTTKIPPHILGEFLLKILKTRSTSSTFEIAFDQFLALKETHPTTFFKILDEIYFELDKFDQEQNEWSVKTIVRGMLPSEDFRLRIFSQSKYERIILVVLNEGLTHDTFIRKTILDMLEASQDESSLNRVLKVFELNVSQDSEGDSDFSTEDKLSLYELFDIFEDDYYDLGRNYEDSPGLSIAASLIWKLRQFSLSYDGRIVQILNFLFRGDYPSSFWVNLALKAEKKAFKRRTAYPRRIETLTLNSMLRLILENRISKDHYWEEEWNSFFSCNVCKEPLEISTDYPVSACDTCEEFLCCGYYEIEKRETSTSQAQQLTLCYHCALKIGLNNSSFIVEHGEIVVDERKMEKIARESGGSSGRLRFFETIAQIKTLFNLPPTTLEKLFTKHHGVEVKISKEISYDHQERAGGVWYLPSIGERYYPIEKGGRLYRDGNERCLNCGHHCAKISIKNTVCCICAGGYWQEDFEYGHVRVNCSHCKERTTKQK